MLHHYTEFTHCNSTVTESQFEAYCSSIFWSGWARLSTRTASMNSSLFKIWVPKTALSSSFTSLDMIAWSFSRIRMRKTSVSVVEFCVPTESLRFTGAAASGAFEVDSNFRRMCLTFVWGWYLNVVSTPPRGANRTLKKRFLRENNRLEAQIYQI